MPDVDPLPRPVRPGALSALLADLVRAPEASEDWARGPVPGEVVAGRFEIVRELGRGGFGVVYEARDRELGRRVAFKAVRAGSNAALREERLLREAESAASLSHPCIVTLHDVGRCEHGPYLVLELLRGQSLAERLASGPLPLGEALRIAVKVAEGLAHAHRQGVVHRDLTPGNVFLCEDGQVKVLDFGLAHAFGQRRQAGGTPAYMAPEQWRGAPEDERTDVFALGVVLYQALTGAPPFPGDDGGRAVLGPRPAPALEVPGAPAVGVLVGRLLEKDPVRRPRDGAEVLAALAPLGQEVERGAGVGVAHGAHAARPVRRRWWAAVASAAAAILVGAFVVHVVSKHAASPVAAGQVTVAVADFANQTGDPELDGLSGLLITSLEQSQRLSVLTRVRMLDLLHQQGKAGVEVVDEALGREVARAAGVRALVLASIRRFDRLYAIELKVLDPEKQRLPLHAAGAGEGKAAVPGMIDRLSERTRERLAAETREERDASRVKVADVTTSSFEAYQHYFKGDQLKESIRYDQAIAEYRKALAIDPNFALPHWRIAYLGEFTGMDDADRRAEMEAALRNVDHVPAKERLLFQAWQKHLDGKDEEAHALYARAAEAYPQDKEVLFLAGDLYLHEDRITEGLPYFERAVALDPFWEPARMHLTDSLAFLLRGDELYKRATEWVEKAPSASAYRALCAAHGLAGRWTRPSTQPGRPTSSIGSVYSRSELHTALVMAERYVEAEVLARATASPGASPMDRSDKASELVEALAYQGRWREATRAIRRRARGPARPGRRRRRFAAGPPARRRRSWARARHDSTAPGAAGHAGPRQDAPRAGPGAGLAGRHGRRHAARRQPPRHQRSPAARGGRRGLEGGRAGPGPRRAPGAGAGRRGVDPSGGLGDPGDGGAGGGEGCRRGRRRGGPAPAPAHGRLALLGLPPQPPRRGRGQRAAGRPGPRPRLPRFGCSTCGRGPTRISPT